MNSNRLSPQSAAEKAVSVIGFGFDLSNDVRLSHCKSGSSGLRLIELDEGLGRDLVLPGGIVVPNVPKSVKCDKGERTRFRSDVVSFHQMSEKFNQELSLSGKIPSGLFNSMFGFSGNWQKDATSTKTLALDGWFITLYNIELARSHIVLSEHVKKEVPFTWDPLALAGFIEKYGTHIIVGVKMGGKDVIHIKQLRNSNLQPAAVQKLLKSLADERFPEDPNGMSFLNSNELRRKDEQLIAGEQNVPVAKSIWPIISLSKAEDMLGVRVRRGGIDNGQTHGQWLSTVSKSPDVISLSLVPISSLLSGVSGGGFLVHAMNLYLRYKPPIEELHQFLEFQLPRQWAPVYGDLPLGLQRKKHASPSLQFTFMGPKLFVNTVQVNTTNRPVTGMRLYLEGKKSDHLAIHLQHLSTLPEILRPSDDNHLVIEDEIPSERGYYEPVKWSLLSHVCTAPVEYTGARSDDSAAIVTNAWLDVQDIGMRRVLFLKLGFSLVTPAKIRRSEWDGPTSLSRKSGSISMLFSTRFSGARLPVEKPNKVDLNSAVFPGGPPDLARAAKMLKFVDTKEMVRGPEHSPGYWVVTGAKLCIEGAKISLKLKYSLLTIVSDDDEDC
ncbi:hypothetical protein Syun_027534 [Stephania yunnanensis]|uniref:MACPF domain-containing protein n=1 Tax=Stephania yunnanensis TaxID=152371 RepID=A0AAP0HL49_9MAGN